MTFESTLSAAPKQAGEGKTKQRKRSKQRQAGGDSPGADTSVAAPAPAAAAVAVASAAATAAGQVAIKLLSEAAVPHTRPRRAQSVGCALEGGHPTARVRMKHATTLLRIPLLLLDLCVRVLCFLVSAIRRRKPADPRRRQIEALSPTCPEEVTADWLTMLLRDQGVLDDESSVAGFDLQNLEGGTHYKVSRVLPTYTRPSPKAPSSMVLKLLTPPKLSLVERYLANWRKQNNMLGPEDRLSQYLKSYEVRARVASVRLVGRPGSPAILLLVLLCSLLLARALACARSQVESIFYSDVAPYSNVVTPRVFLNSADCLNFKFVYMFEDVCHLSSYQLDGFPLPVARSLLRNLARFHASFWNQKQRIEGLNVWDYGGYWTGTKREMTDLGHAWTLAVANFQGRWEEVQADLEQLAERLPLLQRRGFRCHVRNLEPKTLIHGDYKITNLFIDDATHDVTVLDWQWVGAGTAATDVAHFICTSLAVDSLTDEAMRDLLCAYHTELMAAGVRDFPLELFGEHFGKNVLDFFMNTVMVKYSLMTPDDIDKYARKGRDGLQLRSYAHMHRLIQLANRCAAVEVTPGAQYGFFD